jgi:uncharacterized phage protein gp47/JayE
MTFARPSLSAINLRVRIDFDTKLAGADSRVRRNAIDVFAGAHAGTAHGLYAAIDRRTRFFPAPDNAEANARWGSLLGLTRNAPTFATGPVLLGGTDDETIPDGTILARRDTARYVVVGDVTIAAGTATATVTAEQAGAGFAMDEGQTLTFVSPIAGVNATATVGEGGLIGGEDLESEEAWCIRIQEEMRDPPAGGKKSDYVRWAKQVPGVTRVWPESNWDGFGTVRVQFVMDGRDDIIPTVDDVAAVTAAIEAERPITADVTVIAPTPDALDFTITPIPDTPATRAAIAAELADLLARESIPGGTIPLSHFREAISISPGETDHVLTTPSAAVTAAADHIKVMGTITWPS